MPVVFILAVATIGFANATPRTLKQVNILFATTVDSGYPTAPTSAWRPVPGNQVSDFKLTLDGSATTWYFLDIKFIKPLNPIADGYYLFYVTSAPDGYIEWVTLNAPAILNIANGVDPMFYLKVSDGGTSFMLVDGFLKDAGAGDFNVRLQGSYYLGTYTFACDEGDLNGITMSIMFR